MAEPADKLEDQAGSVAFLEAFGSLVPGERARRIDTHAARADEYPARWQLRVIELVPQSDFADAYALAGQRVTAHGGLVPMSGDGVAAPVGLLLRTLKPAQ